MSSIQRTVACPTCGKAVAWSPASRWRPFCSRHCKLIDLGAWATEQYRVPVADDTEPAAPESPGVIE